jgi:hypothetical protein
MKCFLSCLILLGCAFNTKKEVNSFHKIDLVSILVEYNWNCCEVRQGLITKNYNICPEVNFQRNNLGSFRLSNSNDFSFDWKHIKDSTISIKAKPTQQFLHTGNYVLSVIKTSDFLLISLSHTEKDLVYFFTGRHTE